MAVTLESRVRRMQVFNLEHEAYCQGPECCCSEMAMLVSDHNPITGEKGLRPITKRVPGSLTLLALDRMTGLPDAVVNVSELREAIARGFVHVTTEGAHE